MGQHAHVWQGQPPVHLFDHVRVVWVEVPKAASTSIKLALANALLDARFTDDDQLHAYVGYTSPPDVTTLQRWLTREWSSWWRFTVVRNPVDRFESLYHEKIDPDGRGSINAWVAAQADSYWWEDLHAVPQVRIVGDPRHYSYVGRLEDDDLTSRLSAGIGRPIELGRHNSRRGPDREPLEEATRRRLEIVYRDDLKAFGYA